MSILKETSTRYAVRIDERNGPRFAIGYRIFTAMYSTRRQAALFCKELRNHVDGKCKVVKVEVVIRETR